ncbi:MAG: cupredoxin domain-containing protein [Desulfobacterales bacterium]
MKTATIAIIASFAAIFLTLPACAKDRDAVPASEHSQQKAAVTGDQQVVELSVTSDGFVPASFKVRAGHPVKLVVTRKVERTCATDIVIKHLKISAPLPLNEAVALTFTPTQPGTIRFACTMNHIAGEIVVE